MSKNTQEYATIKKANHKLLKAVQSNIIALGAALFAEDLITDDNYTSLKNETRSEVNRAAELVGYVMNRVEQGPENYHIFVKVLKEEGGTYKEVLKILEPIYRDPDTNDGQAGAGAQPQPTNGTQPAVAAPAGGSTAQLRRNGRPEEHQLDRIDRSGKTIRIISSSAARWEKIATRLYFDGNTIGAIRRDAHFQVEHACTTVFNVWLGGKEGLREPKTWATVVAVLKEADLGVLSGELDSILSN